MRSSHLLVCLAVLASLGGAFAACANSNSGDNGGGSPGFDATGGETSGDDSSPDTRGFGDDGSGGDASNRDATGDGTTGDATMGDGGGGDASDADAAPGNDSGSDATGDDASDGGGDGASDAGMPDGANCSGPPKLHPGNGTTIYCPFGPDGGPLQCTLATDECCIGGYLGNNMYAPSDCESFGTSCTNPPDGGAKQFECEEGLDCSNNGYGTICCSNGNVPMNDPNCGYYRGTGLTKTTCEQGPSCNGGEYQICATNAECPNNQTCTPFKETWLQLGFCQ